jgi:hypothetical protein
MTAVARRSGGEVPSFLLLRPRPRRVVVPEVLPAEPRTLVLGALPVRGPLGAGDAEAYARADERRLGLLVDVYG